jgi:hypothetical protein
MKAQLICTIILLAAGAMSQTVQAQTVNANAHLIGDFQIRVKQYAELRDGLATGAARLKTTNEAMEIVAAQQAPAAKIRAARPNAQYGDIFTPEVRPLFRRLLAPQLKGPDGAENKAALRDDNPGPLPLTVNGTYPEKAPLSTVPLDLLKSLPPCQKI